MKKKVLNEERREKRVQKIFEEVFEKGCPLIVWFDEESDYDLVDDLEYHTPLEEIQYFYEKNRFFPILFDNNDIYTIYKQKLSEVLEKIRVEK